MADIAATIPEALPVTLTFDQATALATELKSASRTIAELQAALEAQKEFYEAKIAAIHAQHQTAIKQLIGR